ncbi:restriction endonuclease subunit S [Empedobacter sp. GD03739]|uniref:restriction endonuclease subunit S n=1 Tax=Empedobacter sp. GD03739 TaxID=2975376 RepID=UPI0024470008|nr:restriction endonuclease subunit S [Empedobacter sp. GD03739]MDH1603904.1 restriction endonuclease subunit S [Empedobacter sp. GD03739]
MRADWVECTFDDVFELITNGSSIKQTDDKNGIPVSRIETIWNETIDWGRVKYAIDYDDNLHNKYLLKNGDILFSHINSDSHLGKTAIFRDVRKLIHGINLLLLRPFSILNSSYILYYLKFTKYRGGFLQIAQRSVNQSSINQRSLKQLIISLPPLPEQRAIVKKIEALFSSLDAGIADLKKAQDQLKIYRQAVLKKAFEGELTKSKLDELSIAIGGFAFKSTEFKEIGKYQVIRIGNIRPDNIRLDSSPVFVDSISEKTEKYLLQVDDCVISLTGTRNKRDYGYTALVKTDNLLLNQRLAALRFNKQKIIPKYFLYYSFTDYFKNDFFSAETGNTGQGNVGMNAIKSTEIPVPSLEEQAQIVKEIESRLSVCDAVEQQIKDSLSQAEALRQSILKKAFEGRLLSEAEIKACQQERDYDPASVLLEKIKDEKEANKSSKKTKKK